MLQEIAVVFFILVKNLLTNIWWEPLIFITHYDTIHLIF